VNLQGFIETRLLPAVGQVVENPHLKAVRDAIITLALPFIITGSLFLLAAFPPVPAESVQRWAATWRPALLYPFHFSFGLMAVVVAFGVAYQLAEHYRLEALRTGWVAVAAFLIGAVPVGAKDEAGRLIPAGHLSLGRLLENMGPQGLFVAILLAFVVVHIHRWLYGAGLVIRLPRGVPPRVAKTFEALVPALTVLLAVWALAWTVSSRYTVKVLDLETLTYHREPATLPTLVMELLKPLVGASNTLPSAWLQIFLIMALWSLGIHGMNIVSAVAYPFWTQNLAANVAAAAAGQPLTGIVTEPFFHIYAHLGGSGATLPLVFMLLRSRSAQLRQVGRVALLPGLFNINEPVTFGVPVAFNPVLIPPFILAPLVVVTINYLAMATGLVAPPLTQVPLTVPVILGGFLVNGSWTGAALQAVDLVVAGAIYWPFFRAWERMMLQREATTTPAGDPSTAAPPARGTGA
jgi:PTS system cellobiose-specific IIC component